MLEERTIRIQSEGGTVYECEAMVNLDPLAVDLPDGTVQTTVEFTKLSEWRIVEREMLRA